MTCSTFSGRWRFSPISATTSRHTTKTSLPDRFNTYDIFVRLYGQAAPDRMRAEIDRYEQLFHAELSKFPADRRAELATLCTRLYRARTGSIPKPHSGTPVDRDNWKGPS